MAERKAVLYYRVSTEEQSQGNSLQYQLGYLRDYCKTNNFEIVKEFEEDHSAKTFERPKWNELENFCLKNKKEIDIVLFTRWDRFSRNIEEAWGKLRKYREMGIEINSAENPLDISNPDNKFMMAFYLVAPEVENDKIAKRTKEGTHAAQVAGRFTNKAPKGYTNVQYSDKDRRIVPDEKDAEILRYAFRELSKGVKSIEYVRKEVNTMGLKIGKSAFPELLKNQVYIGKVKVKAWADEPEYWTEGIHEAIIAENTFNKVQEAHFEKRIRPKLCKADDPDFFLKKFVACPECGRGLTGYYAKGNGGLYGYYRCPHGCKFNYNAIKANSKFIEYIRKLKPKDSALKLYEEIINDLRKTNSKDRLKEIKALQTELMKETERLESIDIKYMDGELSPDDYQRMKTNITKRRDKTKTKLESLNPKNTSIGQKLEHAFNVIRNMPEILSSGRLEHKIQLLGSMFPEKIQFNGENYRTNSYNKVLEWIFLNTNELENKKTEEQDKKSLSSVSVPGAGIEPARPLLATGF